MVSRPVMLSMKLLRPSTMNSTPFWRPSGTSFGARMATCTTMTMTIEAMRAASIELLISKP